MTKLISRLAVTFLVFSGVTAQANEVLHDGPWNYLFGNHIDTHQESKLKKDSTLQGRLYIIFTGATDEASGLPVARHPRGANENEECGVDPIDCVVGWNLRGIPAQAKFLYHGGVNGNDHPVWMVNRVDIPNPGAFNHFHWITTTSTDTRAASVSADCDKNNASQLEDEEPTAANDYCDGWFLQLQAIREFAFEHGGEKIPVSPGIDSNTHMNLITNYAEVPGITATR